MSGFSLHNDRNDYTATAGGGDSQCDACVCVCSDISFNKIAFAAGRLELFFSALPS